MTHTHMLKRIALLLLLSAPALAWAFVKYSRIVAPTFNGVTCSGTICVEDPSRFPEAKELYRQSLAEVSKKLVTLNRPPLTVFCSTRACYQSFGGGMERAATIFNLGIIIAPESWVPYLVVHEFIHMAQAQELGAIRMHFTPPWFLEGMPFFISEPPDYDLPDYARPFVAKYSEWERRIGRGQIWREASKL